MGHVDSGDGAYRVPLPVGHVDHPVSQLPVISIVFSDVVQLCPQKTNDFTVCVIVPYEIVGSDISAVVDACDGAVGEKVSLPVAFPAILGFGGGRRCGGDVVEF